jgi:zinc/manganese transport system substrate-binding protein
VRRWPIIALAGVLFAAACGSARPTAAAQGIRVVTTTTVLADFARNVAGDSATVESLLPPGADPHAYQPTPQDAVKISQSDVLILNGAGYERTLETVLENAADAVSITASAGLTAATRDGEIDPHFWVNPRFAVRYVENIRDGLSQVDPANADSYWTNAQAYLKRLHELDAWAEQQTAAIPPERRLLVINHDALGYFADRYGFEVIGVIIPSVSDEAGTTAQKMVAIVDAVRASPAPAIFLDEVENPMFARQIAQETGATVVEDLYFESLSAADGPAATYVDMIRYDVGRIVEVLEK